MKFLRNIFDNAHKTLSSSEKTKKFFPLVDAFDTLMFTPNHVTNKGSHVRYAIDSNKIKKNIGWSPKENFESGILKTVQWYLENLSWSKNIQNGNYKLERIGVNKK